MKTSLASSIGLLALVTAATVTAQTTVWTGATDNDWNTAANWDNGVPVGAGTAIINGAGSPSVALGSAGSVLDLQMGRNGEGGTATLTLNANLAAGQDVFVGHDPALGTSAASGVLNVNAGTLSIVRNLRIGYVQGTSGASGAVTLSGGNVSLPGSGNSGARLYIADGAGSTGSLTINSGTTLTSGRTGAVGWIGNGGAGSLTLNGGSASFAGNVRLGDSANSSLNLYGGQLDVAVLSVRGASDINISEGLLTMVGDWLSVDSITTPGVQQWVNNGWIQAVGGRADEGSLATVYTTGLASVNFGAYNLRYGYDAVGGKTAVWAVVPEPAMVALWSGLAAFGLVCWLRRR